MFKLKQISKGKVLKAMNGRRGILVSGRNQEPGKLPRIYEGIPAKTPHSSG